MFKLGTILLAILTSSVSLAKNKVVYGIDNRVDVYETESTLFSDLSKSTAAMINNGSIADTEGDEVTIIGSTLESRGICSNARFSQQITAASCSGFLVAPNIVITAGHCVTSLSDCRNSKWVFDFKQPETLEENEDQNAEFKVLKSNVYSCVDFKSELNYSNKNDWAIVTLDRNVTDRTPLDFRKDGKVEDKAPLVVIGHPTGLPTKIADGANVRDNYDDIYFSANLDTFGGNSGSAVFNSETGVVEGILVRGETDYEYTSRGCRVPKICTEDGCMGEHVTRITNISSLIDDVINGRVVTTPTEEETTGDVDATLEPSVGEPTTGTTEE